MEDKRIGFEDLSLSLKILVIFGWFYTILFVGAFILGFLMEMTL